MGSDPLVCEIGVVAEGETVGAGSSAGARFRDPGRRGGDDTLGDVASFEDVVSVLAGMGTGAGTGGSWSDVPLGFWGVEGRGTG